MSCSTTSTAITNQQDETEANGSSLKESDSEQLPQEGSNIIDGNTSNDDQIRTSQSMARIPPALWREEILSRMSLREMKILVKASRDLYAAVPPKFKDYFLMQNWCGNYTAKILIMQQQSVDFQETAELEVFSIKSVERIRQYILATRTWVQKLGHPQPIKLKIILHQFDETGYFLSEQKLYAFSTKIVSR